MSELRLPATADPFARDVYTVSRLNLDARSILEEAFSTVWIEGEVSNLARPRSGHMYFTLKDESCQVRCAMFRMHNRALSFAPGDGMQVLAHARVSLYPERGEFQLIVQYMEEAGAGALRRAFDALKSRLGAEGLFDAGHKRPLPVLPRCIGVVTSPTGAAVRDILSVLGRRFPAVPVVIHPVPVQGAGAAEAIARMIDLACERSECDVLILARGGGSLEDLWAFNEEVVARAMHRASIPVVTGVGHEVDFTIADLVADLRAPTPSAAAESVVPDASEWAARYRGFETRLVAVMRRALAARHGEVRMLAKRLVHPRRRLFDHSQRLDAVTMRLSRAASAGVRERRARLSLAKRLVHPRRRLFDHSQRLDAVTMRLSRAAKAGVREQRRAWLLLAKRLVHPRRRLFDPPGGWPRSRCASRGPPTPGCASIGRDSPPSRPGSRAMPRIGPSRLIVPDARRSSGACRGQSAPRSPIAVRGWAPWNGRSARSDLRRHWSAATPSCCVTMIAKWCATPPKCAPASACMPVWRGGRSISTSPPSSRAGNATRARGPMVPGLQADTLRDLERMSVEPGGACDPLARALATTTIAT